MLTYYFSHQYNMHVPIHLLKKGSLQADGADFEHLTYSKSLTFLPDSKLTKSNQNQNLQLLKK